MSEASARYHMGRADQWSSLERNVAALGRAQVEATLLNARATLVLVEQQRVANMIALAGLSQGFMGLVTEEDEFGVKSVRPEIMRSLRGESSE